MCRPRPRAVCTQRRLLVSEIMRGHTRSVATVPASPDAPKVRHCLSAHRRDCSPPLAVSLPLCTAVKPPPRRAARERSLRAVPVRGEMARRVLSGRNAVHRSWDLAVLQHLPSIVTRCGRAPTIGPPTCTRPSEKKTSCGSLECAVSERHAGSCADRGARHLWPAQAGQRISTQLTITIASHRLGFAQTLRATLQRNLGY